MPRKPIGPEIKKKYNFSLWPTEYENMKKIAYVKRRSISDVMGDLIESYVEKNAAVLEEYDRIVKEAERNG